MSKITQADFYFGAALSMLFNYSMIPALVEGGDKRRIYKVITNKEKYEIFMKYRTAPATDNNEYSSWQFIFSFDEITEIKKLLGKEFKILLVCGKEKLNTSEIVVLNEEDVRKCLIDSGKNNFTIGRKKHEKAFRISMGGGRGNGLQIKANSLIQFDY